MSLTRIATASLFAAALGAFALHVGCSKDDEPECTRSSACVSGNTTCTVGVCVEQKCVTQPRPDGTKVTDQTPVRDKLCTKLECKAGKAVEAADVSKTGEPVECNTLTCEGTTLKTSPIMDGVPCRSSSGTCQGGKCILIPDSGPIGPKDGSTDADDDATADTETDAAAD